jgi:multiple sugar transport system ATP-binding protein
MADIRFQGVHKSFGDFAAVDGVDLEVKEGEFMVLLGPSGCGKTTLLRCLAGLERIDEGRVYIGDRDATDLPPRRRRIAMVFQSYAVFPHMKVYDNIAFGLKMQKEKKAVIDERVRSSAELLHIEELLDRYSSQLSGGQRQRVAVARAIATKADVLLMDEPLSNLDALLRMEMRAELKALLQKLGTTTIYVTHDQVEALSMGDRIAVMNAGRLEQVGTPEELYERPANLFVAGFIGSPSMSLVPVAALALELPNTPPGSVLGVRPEHARLWDPGDELLGPLEGEVAYVEALGRETFLGVDTGAEARFVVSVAGRSSVRPGERVSFGLVPGGLRLFDAADGRALGPAPVQRYG